MISLVLVAAGSSTRFGSGAKKEYMPLEGGTVLSCAAVSFLKALPLDAVCVACPLSETEDGAEREKAEAAFFARGARDESFISNLLEKSKTRVLFAHGGATRQESVLSALRAIQGAFGAADGESLCFIHDGARPFVSEALIRSCLSAARAFGAAAPGLMPVDTQKEVGADGFLARHLVRKNLVAIQTPQVFAFQKILSAHEAAHERRFEATDDTEIFDLFAVPRSKTKIVPGDAENRKITYQSDMAHGGKKNMDIRIGYGYDKHLLVEGRKLMLGGVEIPSEKGEAAHSDGDVLLHAVTDAVLGAAALGDIGSYFPSEDAKWKDADSKMLLGTAWRDVSARGWEIGNLDCVVLIERPKFLPHRAAVRASIASIFGCGEERVFVKAKTGEKTGEIGEGKAVEAMATVLLKKPSP